MLASHALPLYALAPVGEMLEFQSEPPNSRRSLSLTRTTSDSSLGNQASRAKTVPPRSPPLARSASAGPTAAPLASAHSSSVRRGAGSHASLFASARALGEAGAGGSAPSGAYPGGGHAGALDGSVKRALPRPAATSAIKAAAPVGSASIGISAAQLVSFLYTCDSSYDGPGAPDAQVSGQRDSDGDESDADVPTAGQTTREVARALKRRMREAEETGPQVECLEAQVHPVTGGALVGRAGVHVVHSWNSDFRELVEALVADAEGDLDKRYLLDVFSADLHVALEDPVATVQRIVARADAVLLLVDGEGEALRRLWVVFEALLALQAGKLHVRCTAPEGFGATEAALKAWEARIDAVDWALAEVSRTSDEKKLRAFAEKEWNKNGTGTERALAHLTKALRQDVYSQILIAAVEKGDLKAVLAALELGADPETLDAMGNTGEALAAFNDRKDIEDLLFERRMRHHVHPELSEWALNPQQLADSEQANWFVTEFLRPEERRESDQDIDIHGELLHLYEQSTCTPVLSSRAESSRSN